MEGGRTEAEHLPNEAAHMPTTAALRRLQMDLYTKDTGDPDLLACILDRI